jgi:C1A family cysteine protease
VSTASTVTLYTTNSVKALKTALNAKPIGVYLDASNWSSYGGGIFTGCSASVTINHAVIAVGYDTSNNWKVRNSWGTGWGGGWIHPNGSRKSVWNIDMAVFDDSYLICVKYTCL